MSGWDVSSTPTWGPQDGPEDNQGFTGQEFGNQDFGRGRPGSPAGGFPEEGQAGGPPPEFFGQDDDPGQGGYPQRTPGRSLQDLPRRDMHGRHSSEPGGGYGQGNGFDPGNGYGQGNGYGPGDGYGQQGGYGHENGYGDGFGQENGAGPGFGHENGAGPGFGHENGAGAGFGHENGYGQDAGYEQGWGGGGQADTWQPGGQENDGWGRAEGRSAAPWDERPQPDAGYPGPDGQEFGQHDFAPDDFGGQGYPRQGPGFAPGFTPAGYEGQDFPGQQDPQGFGRGDLTARNDPALQDFFVPQRGGTGGYPGQGPGRPGDPRERFRAPDDGGWDDQGGRPPGPRQGTGPRPTPRGPRRDDPEPRRGLGTRALVAIGAVVAIIIAGGVYLVMHKSGSGTPTASNSMSAGTTPAAKPSATNSAGAGAGAGGTGTAAAFTLSTPATAGGYPKGQDPRFLGTATATATQITTAISSGGGGAVKGSPVSAAYTLPLTQVITFVGYNGTFTPSKVMKTLASLGSDPHNYPAGANGGMLGCANTTTAPAGAVCLWVTASTLGVTEFFNQAGPETLNAAQAKGAADALKLRGSVETKK